MGHLKLLRIEPSHRKDKKYSAVFETDHQTYKVVHFGAKGYDDYTTHHDDVRKELYLLRHKRDHENWNDVTSPGALSRWILWNKPSLHESIRDFKNRFHL